MVLQRWQSVYLLLATIAISIFAFLPIVQFQTPTSVFDFSVLSLTELGSPTAQIGTVNTPLHNWMLFSVNMLTSIISIITIFKYKNIKLQKKLCYINLALIVSLWASTIIVANNMIELLQSQHYVLQFGIILPAIAMIFVFLAISCMKKDQKILSSYDRIR